MAIRGGHRRVREDARSLGRREPSNAHHAGDPAEDVRAWVHEHGRTDFGAPCLRRQDRQYPCHHRCAALRPMVR